MTQPFPSIPTGHLLFGHLPEMQKDPYQFYLNYHQRHGEYLRFRAFPGIPFYSFCAPDALHYMLITARSKYSRGNRWRKIVGYLGGNGLVTSIGDYWQQQRQRMLPYFQPKKLNGYIETFVSNTTELAKQWKQLPDGTAINISSAMMYLGLINVSDTLFGVSLRAEAPVFSQAMSDSFAYIHRFITNPFTPPRFLPTRFNRHFNQQLAIANRIAYQIIDAAANQPNENILTPLRNAGLSPQALRDEVITLLMAGHDTTATALAWAWYLLAQHPIILNQVQEELKSVLQGNPPTADNYSQLTYTKMVFEETLRLYPSVWAIHRFSEEADEVNGYPVAKGCSIAAPLYVTHRNPNYWQHPNHFYPEHFTKAQCANRPRFTYLPFGAGERVCTGNQFAMLEGIIILAVLLQRFTPKLAQTETIEPTIAFTLKPKRDIIGLKTII